MNYIKGFLFPELAEFCPGFEAKSEHFRKKSKAGGDKFIKMFRLEELEEFGAGGEIFIKKFFCRKKVIIYQAMFSAPGNFPGIGRTLYKLNLVSQPGKIFGKIININPLPTAIHISTIS